MARIKSAWEIALEKTADITIDEEKFKTESLGKEGMALAGKYLNNAEMAGEELVDKYVAYNDEDRALIKKGICDVIFANLNLPSDDLYEMRFSRVSDLAAVVSANDSQVMETMAQIGSFFAQYLQHKEDFVNRMQEQIKQAMQEGDPNMDSSQYAQLIQQNLKKLESQYGDALENTKAALHQMLGC